MDSPFLKYIEAYNAMTPEERQAYDEAIKQRRETEARIERQEKILSLMESSGLGGKFLKRTFDTFKITPDNQKAYDYFHKYAETFIHGSKGVYAFGPNGIGKTHLTAAVANYLLRKGRKVLFIPMTQFKERVYDSYDYNSEESESRIIRNVVNNELVIMDDFDKLNPTENVRELLYKIINRMYESEKSVIITANCNREMLAKIYGGIDDVRKTGKSIASRIAEMCKCVELSGEDWRLRK